MRSAGKHLGFQWEVAVAQEDAAPLDKGGGTPWMNTLYIYTAWLGDCTVCPT